MDSNTKRLEDFCRIDDAYDVVNETLKRNSIPEIDENTDLDEFIKLNSIENSALENIRDMNIQNLNEKYQTQLNVFEKMALNELQSANALLTILSTSKNYIINDNSQTCPVCQNQIRTQEVLEYIDNKQKEIDGESNHLKNWQNENKRLLSRLNDLNNKLIRHDLDDLIDDLEKLTRLEITPSEMNRKALDDLMQELSELEENDDELNAAFDIILLLEKRQKIENELKVLEMQTEVAETTSELFSQKKKEAIEDIFDKLDDLVSEYYKFIHEDDDLTDPRFKVKNSKGLTIGLMFDDEDTDPRSYASEGHLDSLGLCIFLAFAKMYNMHNFLVLDDIISTVDLDHKERIIRLLFEKFNDYTFIITTHNKLWYEQLQRLASSNNIRHKYTFMEIIGWDRIEGPILSKNPSSKKRIEEHLKANDTFAAGNAIRRHLEFVLDDLCKINNIPLPLKQHHTVNDYYKPVEKFFLEEMFAGTEFEEFYKSKFRELNNTAYMGNLTSHNNEANYDLVRSEIEKFRDAVYDFENAFRCKSHNKQYLKFDEKRRIGICANEKCRDIFEFPKISND